MVSLHRQESGYVALMAVLIVGAVTTAIALSLLLGGTDSQRASGIGQQAVQTRAAANACAEEALQQIHDNTAYSGSSNLTLATGTCTYTVTNTGTSTRTITTAGTSQGAVRKVQVYVTISTTSISITSWQEVS